MKLSSEQSQKLISLLNERISKGQLKCPLCGQNQWNLNDVIIESREFQQGNFVIGGQSSIMPFVTLTCRSCANTVFLNAIQLGIVQNTAQQPTETPNEEKK